MNYSWAIATSKEERPIKQILMYHTGMKLDVKGKHTQTLLANASMQAMNSHTPLELRKRELLMVSSDQPLSHTRGKLSKTT